MNYLIVCPKFIDSSSGYYPFPLGIAYINASLKLVRNTVYQLNLNYKNDIFKALKERIISNNIDCIIIGGTSLMYNHINEVTKYARQIKPDIITMVGGGLITAAPEVAMKGLINTDIGMIGEGEYTIRELADALENGNDLSLVDGIIYRQINGELVKTKDRGDIQDLDSIPFPDYDGFEYEKLIQNYHRENNDSIVNEGASLLGAAVICTSRSCPYKCSFCFHTCGNKYRQRSLDNIFEEIDALVEKYNIRYLNILDELFVSNKERVLEFCERIEKYNLIWSASTRVDSSSEEIYKRMKKAGCNVVLVGIESANNKILKEMHKNITIEQISNAFNQAQNAGIGMMGYLLLGDKNETFETFSDTIRYYEDNTSYYLGWVRVIVLPGSELYKYALQNNYINDELKYWEAGFPYLNITNMSDSEYEKCASIMEDITTKRIYSPKSYKILDVKDDTHVFKIEIQCTRCDNKYIIKTSDFTGENTISYNCTNCGQFHNVPIYNAMKNKIDNALIDYLNINKLFIYGVGHTIRRFLYLCDIMQNENVVLIDQDIRKQKNGILGRKVFSPSIIKELNVKFVINGGAIPIHVSSIKDTIEKNYKSVKEIKNFNDFLFDLIKKDIKDRYSPEYE